MSEENKVVIPEEVPVPVSKEDRKLLNRRKWESYIRMLMDRKGLGFQHQVLKKVARIKKRMSKWKHSDPQYGQKLAIAMARNAELKRGANE